MTSMSSSSTSLTFSRTRARNLKWYVSWQTMKLHIAASHYHGSATEQCANSLKPSHRRTIASSLLPTTVQYAATNLSKLSAIEIRIQICDINSVKTSIVVPKTLSSLQTRRKHICLHLISPPHTTS